MADDQPKGLIANKGIELLTWVWSYHVLHT